MDATYDERAHIYRSLYCVVHLPTGNASNDSTGTGWTLCACRVSRLSCGLLLPKARTADVTARRKCTPPRTTPDREGRRD